MNCNDTYVFYWRKIKNKKTTQKINIDDRYDIPVLYPKLKRHWKADNCDLQSSVYINL